MVQDDIFKARLQSSMQDWLGVKEAGAGLMVWWDSMFKGGVKYLAIQQGKEIKRRKFGCSTHVKTKTSVFHYTSPR